MGMTEAEFAREVERLLLATGNVVLRVCDRNDSRHRLYGLRIVGQKVASSGPDYLVVQRGDVPIIRTDDMDDVRAYARHRGGPVFIELKRPGARRRKDQGAQDAWIELVGGGQCDR